MKTKSRWRKVLFRTLAGITLLVVILAIAGVWFIRRPWPQVSGTITASGLTAPVTVSRDEWGVPHIQAQNEQDLLFAQGYVHAQDRLWQMHFNQRVGSGTLSAVLGEATLEIDRMTRTIGMRRAAELDWQTLDEESRAALTSYAAGVNAFIDTHQGSLPVEFTILGVTPEHWTPVDTLIIGKLMGWQLAGDFGLDLLRARVVAARGAEAAEQVLPFSSKGAIVPPEVESYPWLRTTSSAAGEKGSAQLRMPNLYEGSNSWVVAGSRTASGKPLLADDTHLALGMPSLWYENGLSGGRYNSVGFSLPGVPMVVIGHNARIAWGPTNLSTDLQDLYIEKLDDPAQPTKYEFQGEWRDLQIIEEVIQVNGSTPVTLSVQVTHHGPIINTLFDSIKQAQPIALQWPDLKGSPLMRAILQLNRAGNWTEFREAMRYWGAPKQNFLYADVDGNIGYQAVGNVPLRSPGNEGVLPVPGWTGTYEWRGYVPFEEMPTHYNPPSGYIVAANTRAVPPDTSPHAIEYFGVASYRAQYISRALEAGQKIGLPEVQQLQGDTYSMAAEGLMPYLLGVTPENELQTRVLDLARSWDMRYETDSVGASIYEAWHWFLEQNIVKDELGEDMTFQYQRYGLATSNKIATLMKQGDSPWFDDIATEQVETRDAIALRSLRDAIAWLSERYGDDPQQWQWGRLHTMTFRHQPFGESGIAPLEYIFNSAAIPARGGDFTINNGWFSATDPFSMEGGAAQRMIVDLGDLSRSLAIQTTGQSGHLFHPHRKDFIEMWQNMEYHPMVFTQTQIDAHGEDVLTLQPA